MSEEFKVESIQSLSSPLDVRTSGALIADLAARAAKLEMEVLPGDRRELLIHNRATGAYEIRPIKPGPRNHVVHSVESFVDYARTCAENGDLEPVAWHGEETVVLVLDDCDRRDVVTLPIPKSDPLLWLMEAAREPIPMNQAVFVRTLRLKLGQPAELVGRFRKLDFAAGRSGAATILHGKESLGREVYAAVNAPEALPDVLNVSVRVTDVPGANALETIRVGLEIDAQREEFFLCPLPGELEAAVDRMHAALHKTLSVQLGEIPVYYGEA